MLTNVRRTELIKNLRLVGLSHCFRESITIIGGTNCDRIKREGAFGFWNFEL